MTGTIGSSISHSRIGNHFCEKRHLDISNIIISLAIQYKQTSSSSHQKNNWSGTRVRSLQFHVHTLPTGQTFPTSTNQRNNVVDFPNSWTLIDTMTRSWPNRVKLNYVVNPLIIRTDHKRDKWR